MSEDNISQSYFKGENRISNQENDIRYAHKQQTNKNLNIDKQKLHSQKSQLDVQQIYGYTIEQLKTVEHHRVLFLAGQQIYRRPRQQNYWNMLKYTFCPVCSWLSFTTACLIVYLGMFIAEAAIGLKQQGELLEIEFQTAVMLGANDPQKIRDGQVWRLITAAVLHIDFIHFMGNVFSTIIFLSRIQYTIGPIRSFILYLVSAIFGNLFSALISFDTIKMGASTSLYGALGFSIGYLIINWLGLNKIGPVLKCQVVCTSLLMLIFTVVFTSIDGSNIDYYGHLGGFLTGLWVPHISKSIQNTKRQDIIRIIFTILLVTEFITCIILFLVIRSSSNAT